jgi:HEAT repeat protein
MWAIPEALPGLGKHLLSDESDHVRRICSAFMHYFPAADAVPHLLPALADPDPGVVSSCCVSLGLLGDPTAIPSLLGLLDHPGWNTRLEACWALIKLKAADERIVAALEQLMREPEAVEYDLGMDEMNAMPDIWDESQGDEEPEAQARALLG